MTSRYRQPRAKPSPELERLARRGRAARTTAVDTATEEAQVARDRHLREALAAVYGAPKRGMVKGAAAVCLLSAIFMVLLHESVPAPLGVATFALGIILAISGAVMTPQATDAALEEERTWSRSHPFPLEGYFEVLSAKPRKTGGVRAHVTWKGDDEEVDEQLLADAFAAIDPAATLDHADDADVVFASGPINGDTGARTNRNAVLSNFAYPEYIHNLVTKVLVPLAKSHPIDKVRLEAV